MEIKKLSQDYLEDELSLKLRGNDSDETILDIRSTQGVLKLIHPLVDNLEPEYKLFCLLKVEPGLLESVLQTLMLHPGIEYINRVGVYLPS